MNCIFVFLNGCRLRFRIRGNGFYSANEAAANVADMVRDGLRMSFGKFDNVENNDETSGRYRRVIRSDKMDAVQPSGRTIEQILAEKPDFGSRRVY